MRKKTTRQQCRKEMKLLVYVLYDRTITFETAHFDTSLLNSDAPKNAV